MTSYDDIHRQVSAYYTRKLREHGATARGVDWNSEASQALRFDQLLKIAQGNRAFSLNEIGCGYGALVDHIRARDLDVDYCGVDLSAEMVRAARDLHAQTKNAAFLTGNRPDRPRDYCVASGIFNVRLDILDDTWRDIMFATLDLMHESSVAGFAFNALTSYADAEKKRADLYYADPLEIFDHCKRNYSPNIALLHDYGLYEFTILVRKTL